MALNEQTKVTLRAASLFGVVAALAWIGWEARAWAEKVDQAEAINTTQTAAIQLLTTAQQASQWQINQVVETQKQMTESQKHDHERQREVEDAILTIKMQIEKDQRNR